MTTTQHNKLRWGDVEEDDTEDLHFPVPRTHGINQEAGTKLKKAVQKRRSCPKFGDAIDEDVGASLTMVSTEEVFLERFSSAQGSKQLSPKEGGVLMVCRSCGKKGDHWTARCPYKDQEAAQTDDLVVTNSSSYLPPARRPGAASHEENCVRVTNLSEDTRETGLCELFGLFGDVTRVYVALDHKSGKSKGFGFVKFVSREDAERAIHKLDGYGYDNLILGVEWTPPRAN